MATTAVLNLGLNSSQFDKGLNKSKKKLIGFQKTTIGFSTIVGTVLTGALARAGWSMIKLASDAEETGTKFLAVFKGIERESSIVADSLAQSFGLASSTARQLLGDTGDILSGFGFTRGEALKLSNQVNELAIDLASFTNFAGGAKGASGALTKALLGETEQAKALGIVIRQSTPEFKEQVKEIKKLTGATEQQARTQAIWKQIVDQSKNALGDYGRTADGTANRIRLMGERWKELQETTGKFLIDGLEVDKILETISRGMFRLASESHNVRLAIKGLAIDTGSALAKTWIQTKGFIQDSIDGYNLLWTKATGSDGEFNRLKQRIKFEDKLRKAQIDGVEQFRKKALKKEFEAWAKVESKKKTVTTQNADEAIKTAIEKTSGRLADVTGVSKTGDKPDPNRFADTIKKGSIEAQQAEKTTKGNSTDRNIEKWTRQTAENTQSQIEVTETKF